MRIVRLIALLGLVPIAIFWGSVEGISSVFYGFVLVALWYLACCLFFLRGRNAALAAFSVAISIVAAEGLLRTRVYQLVDPTFAHFVGVTAVERGELAEHDDALGYRLIANAHSHVVDYRDGVLSYEADYTTDENGFRKDSLPRLAGPQVLILGDSYAFGEGLNDNETLGYFLKKRSLGAINLGMPGAGPQQALRQLQIGLPRRISQPYSHILLSVIDDYIARAHGRKGWLVDSPRFEIADNGALELVGTFRPESTFVDNLLTGSRLASMIVNIVSSDTSDDEEVFVGILREINRIASESYGAPLLVLYHSGNGSRTGNLVGNRRKMHTLFCRAGVSFLDIYEAMPGIETQLDRYFIPLDGHPAGPLNAAIADLVADRFAHPGRDDGAECKTAGRS